MRTAAVLETRTIGSDPTRPPRWWPAFIVCLFAAALGWRLLVLERLSHGPLLEFLTADADDYWRWANEIRSGRWIPGNAFFLGPLYPYGLAAVRSLVGDSITAVCVMQSIAGALAVVLLADAARRIATPLAATVIGVALGGYAMAVFFDLQILMESPLFFMESLLFWLVARFPGRRRLPLLVGGVIGLMGFGRASSFLLLLPAAMVFVRTLPRRRAVAAIGQALVVPALAATLMGMHHLRVTGEWIPSAYSGGYNFYVGNGPMANGTYVPFTRSHTPVAEPGASAAGGGLWDGRSYLAATQGLRLTPGESSRYWVAQVLAHAREHPFRVARLFVLKLGLLLNHRELPHVADATAYDRTGGPLGWPLAIEFAFFSMLGLVGIPLAWRSGAVPRFVAATFLVTWLAIAAFYVVDRYRIHLIPPLALMAALALARSIELWRAGDRGRLAWIALGAAGGLAIAFAPLVRYGAAHQEWATAATVGEAWLSRGVPQNAGPPLEQAIAIDRAGRLEAADAPTARVMRARVYENLGIARSQLGDSRGALASYETALRLAPDAAPLRARYADQLVITGAAEEAVAQYRVLGLGDEEAAERLIRQALDSQARGDTTGLHARLWTAALLAPRYERAIIPLVRLEIRRGDLDAASVHLRRARDAGLDPDVWRAHAAWINAARGDRAGARRLVASIPVAKRTTDPRVAGTLAMMKAMTGE